MYNAAKSVGSAVCHAKHRTPAERFEHSFSLSAAHVDDVTAVERPNIRVSLDCKTPSGDALIRNGAFKQRPHCRCADETHIDWRFGSEKRLSWPIYEGCEAIQEGGFNGVFGRDLLRTYRRGQHHAGKDAEEKADKTAHGY